MFTESLASKQTAPSFDATEAHHRIANHLVLLTSVLQLRTRQLKEKDGSYDAATVREVLDDIRMRMESIGHLHRLLMVSGQGRMSLFRIVGEVCTKVSSIFPPGHVFLSMNCDADGEVSSDQVVHVGRIVAEMVTNAVKYAHPTGLPVHIEVRCRKVNDSFEVEVCDDGVGLPENFDARKDGGLGFRLMRSSAASLNGRVLFEGHDTGLRSRLIFPAEAASPRDNVVAFKSA